MLPALPQEIIDLIVDELEGSQSTLKTCSLVSRRWTVRCQQHLFSRTVIHSNNLRRWCREITPGPTGVSSYTTNLVLFAAVDPLKEDSWFEPNLLTHASDHLNSFTNIHTLDIVRWKFPDNETYTTPFSQVALTTRNLGVIFPVLGFSTFLSFITMFNRAESISIIRPQITTEESAEQNLPYIPCATFSWASLRLLDFSDRSLPLLGLIARLPLQLVNLSVGLQSPSYHDGSLTALLRANSETLQTLQLCRSMGDPLSAVFIPLPLVLPPLPQLRSIRFCALLGVGWLRAETLLSITSKYIAKITIEMQYLLDPVILGNAIDWDAIDRALQVLEIQSKSHRASKLVVQFYSLTYEWKEEVSRLKERTRWLPRFERSGVIEIV